MKVSKSWLQELIDLKVSISEVERLLPLRTIATKEITEDFIELDMKGYNRADLLSMRGVAVEVAAITDSQVKFSEPKDSDYSWVSQQLPTTPVTTDEKINPVQAVAKIEGLKAGKSPADWVKKLSDSGMRSVNDIVDITNLIMLEYGHPFHSFDAATVKNDTINVRRAKDGEELLTLDGKLRKLTTEDIVLADDEKALDIAGIMGGKDTEISDSTTTILLSGSFFNPHMIRKTAKKLGLGTESTKRFYHGLTRKRLFQAFNAAIKMYQDLGGKVTALTIVGDTEDQLKKVPLRLEKVNSLIGVEFTAEQVEEYLTKLGFSLNKVDGSWVVTPPYYRLDIQIEEDLIEEVARMYGYEKIPAKELVGNIPEKVDQSLFEMIYKIKTTLVDLGLTEVQTYSFVSTRILRGLTSEEVRPLPLVQIANPMSAETEYLREFIWFNLIEVVERAIKQDYKDIAVFELGKVYFPGEEQPKESYRLAIALMNGTDNPAEELAQIFRDSIGPLGLQNDIEIVKEPMMDELKTLFHPTRYTNIKKDGKVIGGLAEAHPRLLHSLGVEKRVAILEISLESLL